MSTDVLTLMQWMSPGFPVGAFAYSHGLETVIASDNLRDAETLRSWVTDIIRYGAGRSDATLLAEAWRSTDNAEKTEAVALALASGAERLTETRDQGAAFARTVDDIWQTAVGPCTYPVAVGLAAARRKLPLDLTAEAYLHAFAANLISAAVRLVPLGQTEGQKVLADLGPLITEVAGDACAEGAPLYSNCIAGDIAAMRHETQYSKVFRT
ncbi:urease accessory protein UreF [uncultured Roseobacter sp.]|uniref:urease accessory protein UreF n=1 Tax=uncultured Roseobacter sp. TaxID=114847 RepID=UPI00262125C5|nr:urease accessory UreF family protein [uncultured Roseobacter sp.]